MGFHNRLIQDIYPLKGQFLAGERIDIVLELKEEWSSDYAENVEEVFVIIEVSHLQEKVYVEKILLSSLQKPDDKHMLIKLSPMLSGGYGVYIRCGDVCYNTAFDVANHSFAIPRYGFLSNFGVDDEEDQEDILSMTKLHINLVQFYDWMYRHENLVSEEVIYRDLMGKEMFLNAIKNKIKACHEHGMKTMAYGAVYAASNKFYEGHPDWGLYNNLGKPITFIDLFYIMDIRANSPWHEHITREYQKAIQAMEFDGIHMDTYGFPKTAYDVNEERISLDQEFPVLIDHTKEALNEVKPENIVIFNNVGNWPVYATAPANQDILYVEVWEPYVTYEHIQRIILEAKAIRQKPLIIAAYLRPFMTDGQNEATIALKLITACIVANGATHLIMGENKKVLTQGYYVDHYSIEDFYFEQIRKYYDFFIRYGEFFFNTALRDVSMSHAYGDNQEYSFYGVQFSSSAEENKVWTVIRESDDLRVISLINLTGNNNMWNEAKKEPEVVKNINITMQIEKNLPQIYLMSPENPDMIEMSYQVLENKRGRRVEVSIGELELWTVIIVRR
jgi:hypothetical protein